MGEKEYQGAYHEFLKQTILTTIYNEKSNFKAYLWKHACHAYIIVSGRLPVLIP